MLMMVMFLPGRYTIEFQKRGLPHAHLLFKLAPADALRTPDQYDELISAQIPDPIEQPQLYQIVAGNMLHGPCGVHNPRAPCMMVGDTMQDLCLGDAVHSQ
jgi:hypothetical protein